MSRQIGELNREKFLTWIAKMKSKDSANWLDYWHGDALSPKAIADELGFDASAFKKRNNEKLFDMMQALNNELAQKGIYQKGKRHLANNSHTKVIKSPADVDITDSTEIRELKKSNLRLQADNAKLTAELTRLSEFKNVLTEMGLWK